jgi:diphosphoinositol-polyphosphate diphosphatase
MSTVIGREKQRYDGDTRLVAGCVPFRLKSSNSSINDSELLASIEILMIKSRNRDDYIFPKGGWEVDESVEEAAQREAHEEGGVKGVNISSFRLYSSNLFRHAGKIVAPLGIQDFLSPKGKSIRLHSFLLHVTEEICDYLEVDRERVWVLPYKR